MKDKVLFVATLDEGHINKFHIPYLKLLSQKGYEVHVACSGNAEIPYCDFKHKISFKRNPYNFSNFYAYKELKDIIFKNNYRLIHCHTPIGGVVGRLAARQTRIKGTKVLYTVHGFHFFKEAPLINWLVYYPIEKWLSKYTDCIITLNEEDYNMAISKKFKADEIIKIDGVGIDLNKFKPQTVEEKLLARKEYGYSSKDFILSCTADLNHNKNQGFLIDIIMMLKDDIPEIKLLLIGEGVLKEKYKEQMVRLGLENNIKILGFRKDVPKLLMLTDIVVSASKREGLPVNIMEAMASGLPTVVTNVRGNRDLVYNGENGFVVNIKEKSAFAVCIKELYKNSDLRNKYGKTGYKLVQKYSLDKILLKMEELYDKYL